MEGLHTNGTRTVIQDTDSALLILESIERVQEGDEQKAPVFSMETGTGQQRAVYTREKDLQWTANTGCEPREHTPSTQQELSEETPLIDDVAAYIIDDPSPPSSPPRTDIGLGPRLRRGHGFVPTAAITSRTQHAATTSAAEARAQLERDFGGGASMAFSYEDYAPALDPLTVRCTLRRLCFVHAVPESCVVLDGEHSLDAWPESFDEMLVRQRRNPLLAHKGSRAARAAPGTHTLRTVGEFVRWQLRHGARQFSSVELLRLRSVATQAEIHAMVRRVCVKASVPFSAVSVDNMRLSDLLSGDRYRLSLPLPLCLFFVPAHPLFFFISQ